jgi:hypothetical protein
VRLRTCIALELFVAVSTLTGVGAGAVFGFDFLRAYAPVRESTALAATMPRKAPAELPAVAPPVVAPEPAPPTAASEVPVAAIATATQPPAAELAPPAAPTLPAITNVFGTADAELVAPLREPAVTRIKINRGGTSLSLRLDFENGSRAAFKPEQIHAHSNPRREIAAFRVDRLLGLGRVPPAIARRFPVDQLMAALDPSMRGLLTQRLKEEAVARDGAIAGEVSWWVPVITDAEIRGFRIDVTDGIVTWRRLLRAGGKIPDRELALVRQISDMVVFDFLLDNIDRWSGSNTKASPDGKTLYYMDNTMSFSGNREGHSRSHLYLERVQTFSKRLIAEVRGLDKDKLEAVLVPEKDSPLPFLLTRNEIAALLARRDVLIRYVDDLIAQHGEETVLAFP